VSDAVTDLAKAVSGWLRDNDIDVVRRVRTASGGVHMYLEDDWHIDVDLCSDDPADGAQAVLFQVKP
jgi:hypothetical protein